MASTGHDAVWHAGPAFSLPTPRGRTNLRGPMSYAGDLSAREFDALLDRSGGPAVVVHGGAGTRPDHDPAPYLAGTRAAAEAGLRVLLQGGSALDAAQAAAVVLEDDPSFNAGTGACLTAAGDVELDASCMDGSTLRAGAVACVKTMKNPILAARRVCDDTPHVLLCGPGAEAFARECGIPEYPNELLVTPRQRARACAPASPREKRRSRRSGSSRSARTATAGSSSPDRTDGSAGPTTPLACRAR